MTSSCDQLDADLTELAQATQSPYEIAHLRQRVLCATPTSSKEHSTTTRHSSLPAWMLHVLTQVVQDFIMLLQQVNNSDSNNMLLLSDHVETQRLAKILEIHWQCCTHDRTLAHELGRQGTHGPLLRVIQCHCEDSQESDEANQDCLMELQDVACTIAALYGGQFPMRVAPLTVEELQQRLALVFDIDPVSKAAATTTGNLAKKNDNNNNNNNNTAAASILIHQVTKRQSEQADVGFVMWPSAVVLSRWIATNPRILDHAGTILEIGAGCGLVGLYTAKLLQEQPTQQQQQQQLLLPDQQQQQRVILTDFNPQVLENLQHNMALNNINQKQEKGPVVCMTQGLDFYQQTAESVPGADGSTPCGWVDMTGQVQPAADVILGADIICQPSDAVAAARTVSNALRMGGRAYIVCATSAHRYGVDVFPGECQRLGLSVQIQNVAHLYEGALLSGGGSLQGLEKTAGYVAGMELTMFQVEKPTQ